MRLILLFIPVLIILPPVLTIIPMLRYIYDRSKNNQGNLILWAESADTFMYHNNKDNSIKTPIMARYNTPSAVRHRQGRGNILLFIYHHMRARYRSDISEYNVRFLSQHSSPLPAIILRECLPVSRLSVLGSDQPPNIPRTEALLQTNLARSELNFLLVRGQWRPLPQAR